MDDTLDPVHRMEVRLARLEEQFIASELALKLQRVENDRRLHELNGEYKRDRERQQDFVSTDKYEDKIAAMDEARIAAVESEKEAREAALLRVDEKFDEYVKRWEQIQREQAAQIATLSQAAAEAKRIAEDQGRMTRGEADAAAREQKSVAEAIQSQNQEMARKQSRNIAIIAIAIPVIVSIVVLLANGQL